MDRPALQERVMPLLPTPCCVESRPGGKVRLIGGDPGEVIVTLGAGTVAVAAFTVDWDGPAKPVVIGDPVATSTIAEYPSSGELLDAVASAVRDARARRLATYQKCSRCGETTPPEWMHDRHICQECAVRYLGVVY